MGIFKKPVPRRVVVLGEPLHCLICGHDEFIFRAALGVICASCGFVHDFLDGGPSNPRKWAFAGPEPGSEP